MKLSSAESFRDLADEGAYPVGRVIVEEVGRELLCRFDDPNLALSAAQTAQIRTGALRYPSNLTLLVRVGIHFGEFIVDDGGVYGDTVNVASRMADIARGGQIISVGLPETVADDENSVTGRYLSQNASIPTPQPVHLVLPRRWH